MDGSGPPSYLRGVRSKRPTLTVTLVTVVASCVLAVGGYLAGGGSGANDIPGRVPLRAQPQPQAADPIPLPSAVDLPHR